MPALLGATQEVEAVLGAAGTQNAGNWTATFGPQVLGVSLATFECFRIAVKGGPPGSSLTVYIGTSFWDSTTPGNDTAWDPNQTMKLQQGQTVYFYWNSATATVPTVTMWLQESSAL